MQIPVRVSVPTLTCKRPRGVVVNLLNCDIVVSEFEL